jgi:hypothetical protein
LGLNNTRTKDLAQGAVFVAALPETSWAISRAVSRVGSRREYHGEKQDVAMDRLLIGAGHIDRRKENSTPPTDQR